MIGQRAELVASRSAWRRRESRLRACPDRRARRRRDAVCADGLRRRGVAHRRSGADDEDAGARIRARELGSGRPSRGPHACRGMGDPVIRKPPSRMPDVRRKRRRSAELARLEGAREWDAPWRKWGPYLSERQWGTVREDYSQNGEAWEYFPHDHARSRAYHWGEDGLAGFCDVKQRLCFAVALWNGKDPILKERLFGLSNAEGNHGEDVKEYVLLSRFHADPLVHEVAVQVPPGRLPVRRPREDERAADAQGLRVRARRHRRLRRRPLLRRLRRIRQVVSGGMLHPDHRCEPGPRDRDDPPAAHAVVPQHVVLVARPGETAPGGGERISGASVVDGFAPGARRSMALLRRSAAAAVHRERHEYRAALRHAQREPLRQGRLSRVRRAREDRRRQPGGGRHQGRRPLPPRGRRRPVGGGPALPHRCAAGEPSVRGLRQNVRRQAPRGGRVLPIPHAGVRQQGRRARHATGLRGPVLDEAVLLLRRQHVAPRARRAIRSTRRRRSRSGTASGSTCSTTTSSRCRTSGSTRGMPPGISPFTRSRWRASTRTSPSISST